MDESEGTGRGSAVTVIQEERTKMAKSRKKKKSGLDGGFLLLLVILAVLFGAGSLVYRRYGPVKERMTEAELFSVSGENTAIMYEYELQQASALFREGEVYIPVAWVQTILNPRFYWEGTEQLLSYVLPDGVRRIRPDEKDEAGRRLLIAGDGGKAWISASLVEELTDLRIERFTDGEVRRIFISVSPEADSVAAAKRKTAVRAGKSWRRKITAEAAKGAKLRLIPDHPGREEETEEDKKWQRVMTENGVTGYVLKSSLKEAVDEPCENRFRELQYPSKSLGKPVVLGWHQVTVDQANKYLGDVVSDAEGMNVISPTWYTLKGNEGEFESRSSRSYVEEAHKAGLQVWPLLDNLDGSVTLGTMLEKDSVRKKLIDGLMEEAEACGFDGINLDFELLRKDAVDQYLEFVREMYAACREKKLILSVDVPNYASYNWHYTREELGVFCDYVVNMGYDEHTAGDSAGSTASIGFFTRGLEDTLEEVPAEKLIGGVPFYTRIWRVRGSETTSEAVTMKGAAEWVRKNGVELVWDEALGQYRGSVTAEDGTERLIWMEESRSLGLKAEALKESGAAGIACWRLGQEEPEVWKVIGGFQK